MHLHKSITGVIVLLSVSLCASRVIAQDARGEVNPSPKRTSCLDSLDASHAKPKKLPTNFRFWLTEDAVYLLSPEERCAFLRLNTDQEREQFIEQFWNSRAADPNSPDDAFKVEHYRRIVYANEEYGGPISGWKTDRGRIYILFGPPDSIQRQVSDEKTDKPSFKWQQLCECPREEWHYQQISGRESLDFVFADLRGDGMYGLVFPEPNSSESLAMELSSGNRGDLNSTQDADETIFHVGPMPVQRAKFKDLEAIVVSRIVRNQLRFDQQLEFLPATHITTLVRLRIELPQGKVQPSPSDKYALFIRVSRPSGWVMSTSELTVGQTGLNLIGGKGAKIQVDIPLPAGNYELAIVAKDLFTGDVGVMRSSFDVPAYAELGQN